MAQQMPMQTPRDLFVHDLSDLLSAERQIVTMLGEAAGMASNADLKQALTMHRQQSEQHARNVQDALDQLNAQPHPVTCRDVQGIHEELKEVAQSHPSPQVLDGVITGGAAKNEHYEIASYGGLVKKAQAIQQIAQRM